MKNILCIILSFSVSSLFATTWYVAKSGSNSNTGKSESAAFQTIQKAIDSASIGDSVLVAPGTYDYITVPATKEPLTIVATGSASDTTIKGGSRCVTIGAGTTTNVFLKGFTITGGYDDDNNEGGGVYGGTVISCTISNNYARMGGGAYKCVLKNCQLVKNRARVSAAAALQCTLVSCTVQANSCSDWIAGIQSCEAEDCQILDNVGGSSNGTGGASGSTLRRCSVLNNSGYCGGADDCILYNCIIKNNKTVGGSSTSWRAAGANNCTAYNTLIIGNTGDAKGIGVNGGTYYNCTILSNPSRWDYSSVEGGVLYNCIIGGSSGTCKINNATVKNCCLWNTSETGTSDENCYFGNPSITSENTPTLMSGSQCINAGNNSYVMTDSDIDGNVRIYNDRVDIGAYEYWTPSYEVVDGDTWAYHIKSGKVVISGVETDESRLTVPDALGGYTVGAIDAKAFQNASNVVEMTIPADVSIADKALASCANLQTVHFEGLPTTSVVPGFYYAKFENFTNWLDKTNSIVDASSEITLMADKMTDGEVEEYTMYGYATYMHFEAGQSYEFVVNYDNLGAIDIDGTPAIHAGFGMSAQSNTVTYANSGWHWIELRGWNNDGPGGTSGDAWDGIRWRKAGEAEWRVFADPGDGSRFRAKMGNLSDVLSGTKVENVSFGEGVTIIPDNYFVGAENLKSVAFADTLTNLGDNDIRVIGVNGGKTEQWIQNDWLLGYIGESPSVVTISDDVHNIAPYAFEGQTNLTRIILSDELNSIGTNAFIGCTLLESIYAPKVSISNVIEMLTASGLTNATDLVKIKVTSPGFRLMVCHFGHDRRL